MPIRSHNYISKVRARKVTKVWIDGQIAAVQ